MKKDLSAIPSILPVTGHTDYVGNGTTFVAIKGAQLDGTHFIPVALEKGATKIVIQNNAIISENIQRSINLYNPEIIKVEDCRKALSELSAQAWNYPAKKLNIIGITGTKGKTTSTFLVHHLLNFAGYKTAMLSGVQNIINGQIYEASLTTPLPDYLHSFLNKCVEEQVQFVVMESSAQAFSLQRLYGIEFSGCVFTNLDLEHSEFYSTMNEYFEAKCEIFKQMKPNAPVIINKDNQWGEKIASKNKNFLTFSLLHDSNFRVQVQQNDSTGIKLLIECTKGKYNFFAPNLVGHFNAYNLAGVIALALELNIYPKTIMDGLLTFSRVPGRMERYSLVNGSLAVIDYAHNPSSFTQILPTLKTLSNKLIVVFGTGGDRDKQKRPIMGNIAATFADKVIITSDNPRSENAQDIINQIFNGIPETHKNKVICENDRAKAIQLAYDIAKPGNIIAILGKGPDEYQIIGNKKEYFSDKETILSCK